MKGGYLKWVPADGKQGQEWYLSAAGIRRLVVLGGVLFVLSISGWLALAYTGYLKFSHEKLSRENTVLRDKIEQLLASMETLDRKLDSLYQRDLALRTVLGENYPTLDPAILGIGGTVEETKDPEVPLDVWVAEKRLARLEKLASQELQSYAYLKEKVEKKRLDLALTPSIVPVKGYLSSTFGYRRDPFTGRRKLHEGVDISAPFGTPVRVTADGVVVRVKRDPGYGLMVEVRHGKGLTTRYGHNSRVFVRPGQRVKRGDVIALVGSTGKSTGPHVHYEVRLNGKPLNPLDFIIPDQAFYD